jgi:Na+/proline symporter
MRVVSLVALVAAGFGAVGAYLAYWAGCLSESGGSTMCPMNEPSTTMTAQLVVGYAGVLPAAVMVFFAFRGRPRAARAALVVALVTWAVWALLVDATVHGWNDDMQFL